MQAEPLLERAAEVAALEELLEEAIEGRGQVVVVEGAAGIGKTTLLGEARRLAREHRAETLAARGAELEREYAFGVVRQLFDPALERLEPGARKEVLGGAAGGAAALFDPAAAELPATEDARFRTYQGLYWLISNLAETRPLVLLVDDVHWADRPSLGFLDFLTRRLADLPLLLVVAARPAEPGADRELADRLVTEPGSRTLRPEALSEPAAATLVRERLPEASEGFCAACHTTTGGNPFLLAELTREIAVEGIPTDDRGADRVGELAPSAVSRSVLLRLARLPDEAVGLARAVAVLAGRAPLHIAAGIAELGREPAREASDTLSLAGILVDAEPLRFVHPLIRAAVYDDLPQGLRSTLHERAAKLLADAGAAPEQLAAHLALVEPSGDPETVALLREAARRSLARGASDAAAAYLHRAREEPPPQEERDAVLLEQLSATVRSGVMTTAPIELLEEAIAAARRSGTLAAYARDLAYGVLATGDIERGVALLEEAIEGAADDDRELALRLEADHFMLSRMGGEAAAKRERARRLIDLPGETPGEAVALAVAAATVSVADDTPDASMVAVERLLAGGCLFADATTGSLGWIFAVIATDRAERYDLSDRMMRDARDRAQRLGSSIEFVQTLFYESRTLLLRGRVEEAELAARHALDIAGRGGVPQLLLAARAALFPIVRIQGRHEEAEAIVMELEAGYGTGVPASGFLIDAAVNRMQLSFDLGRFDEAAAAYDRAWETMKREELTKGPNVGLTDGLIAIAAVGRRDEALARASAGVDMLRKWGTAGHLGGALRIHGQLEEGERAVELLREAVSYLGRSEHVLEHAQALIELGTLLRRARDRKEAREPLRSALEVLAPTGAHMLIDRARVELAATGERARKRAVLESGAASLTASERRVAELAAQGLSNREIAQALFLTVKTVETHLSKSYRKLDVSGRSELAGALDG